MSLYVREEASRTPLEPWEKARWWWSESKERPIVVVLVDVGDKISTSAVRSHACPLQFGVSERANEKPSKGLLSG